MHHQHGVGEHGVGESRFAVAGKRRPLGSHLSTIVARVSQCRVVVEPCCLRLPSPWLAATVHNVSVPGLCEVRFSTPQPLLDTPAASLEPQTLPPQRCTPPPCTLHVQFAEGPPGLRQCTCTAWRRPSAAAQRDIGESGRLGEEGLVVAAACRQATLGQQERRVGESGRGRGIAHPLSEEGLAASSHRHAHL